MEFVEAVRARRSVRGFKQEEVPRDVIERALDLSQWAPSNCNVQPWRVYIASSARLAKLREALLGAFDAGEMEPPDDPIDTFHEDYRGLQVACAAELYGAMGIARDDRPARAQATRRNFEFFDAPHVAYICQDRRFGLGVALDVGAYLQTFMLALSDAGVSSCPQASLRCAPKLTREILEIPEELRIMCGVSFGYEDEAVPANASRQKREPFANNAWFRN